MNDYEAYLESLLELREQEISIYKDFIEKELRCRIQEEVRSKMEFDNNGRAKEEVRFKIITIPESKYFVRIDP